MRIIWVRPFLTAMHSSSELEIVRRLEERGFQIVLLSTNSGRLIESKYVGVSERHIPLKYVPLLSSLMFSTILFFALPFYVVSWKADFVLMDVDISLIGSIPSLIVSRFTGTKFLFDIRSMPVELSGPRGRLKKFAYSLAIFLGRDFFDGMTTITSGMRNEVCATYGVDPSKAGIWSSGVSPETFSPKSLVEGERFKKALDLGGRFVVFYHGAMSPNRGLVETVEAIDKLDAGFANVVLFLLGTGPALDTIKALIRDRGLEGRVIIHDPVPYKEVPDFISIADVCIVPLPNHPYWVHQSPLKLLEYLAMGKVVIATDIPPHRLVMGSEICAVYIKSSDPAEIACSIEYAYNNRRHLESWGKVGCRIIEERYTWAKAARDLETYLLSMSSEKA